VTHSGQAVTPSKIVCVGRNYVRHIEELGNEVPEEMVVFLKPNSAIGDTLASRHGDEPLHYEGEIALLVQGGQFTAAAFGLDLTRREKQSALKAKGLPWERAKAFDGSALFSPFVSLDVPVTGLGLRLAIDGAERQTGKVSLMLFKPEFILAEIGRFMSLEDNDIIMTGTPAGVGEVTPGARFHGQLLAGDRVLSEARWQAEG
jgi:2-keto-4-pentenoate hydratase/2-oxohepta-3-ene-1,7-dioic acid hydratase in catechol pathway